MMALLRVDAAVPRLPLPRGRAEVEARPDEPQQEEGAGDAAEDDAGDGAAREVVAAAAAAVVGVGHDGHGLGGLPRHEGGRVSGRCHLLCFLGLLLLLLSLFCFLYEGMESQHKGVGSEAK